MKASKMMDMLHGIRQKHWNEIKSLKGVERVAVMRMEAEAVRKSIQAMPLASAVKETSLDYSSKASPTLRKPRKNQERT
jgi:hypothetical protein